MRVSFVTEKAARAAVNALASYGYLADRIGNDVVTDCPPLLAVSSIERAVGFGQIERLDLSQAGDGGLPPAALFSTAPEREVAALGVSPDVSTGYLPACASA